MLARFKVLFPSDQPFVIFSLPSPFSESPAGFNEGEFHPEDPEVLFMLQISGDHICSVVMNLFLDVLKASRKPSEKLTLSKSSGKCSKHSPVCDWISKHSADIWSNSCWSRKINRFTLCYVGYAVCNKPLSLPSGRLLALGRSVRWWSRWLHGRMHQQ